MSNKVEVLSELDLDEPPQDVLEWAQKNLNEDPDTRCKVLEDFRNMIFSEGECEPHRTDDAFLLRFLRARYFKLKPAYNLLCNYCNFKETYPEIFENVNLKNLQRLGKMRIITVPPYRDQNGRRILQYRFGQWDPSKCSIDEVFQASWVVLELAILEQRAQILGGIAIFDFGDLTLNQSMQFTPSMAYKAFQIMVTSFPMKIHAVHIVNQSWVFDMIFSLFKPFMNERMRERVYFHGDNHKSLQEHIHPDHLAKRYGGVHPEYDPDDWMKWFYNSPAIIREMQSLGYHDDDVDITQ